MRSAWFLAVVVALLPACGGSDEGGSGTLRMTTSGATTEFTAEEVEEAFGAELQSGDRVVDLGTAPPKSIECTKGESPGAWDCRVTPAEGGRTMLCMVVTDPSTRIVTTRRCAPVDY